ncbi:MAG: LytR/AlgR family response regulator transcription factor [Bacteroidia bacterium]
MDTLNTLDQKEIVGANFYLNILIVEDNLSFALELEMLLEELNYKVAGRVDNSAEALESIMSGQVDLVLMDIDIKGKMSGLEVGQKVKHLDIPILYITSHGDETHYKEALKSNMIGYLVKPIDSFTLRSALLLAVHKAHVEQAPHQDTEDETSSFIANDQFFFRKRNTYHRVRITEIAYIESDDNYISVHTLDEEKFVVRFSMSKIEELLPENTFIRVHRKYIVQLKHITVINFQQFTLKVNQVEIPISRSRRKDLELHINRLD